MQVILGCMGLSIGYTFRAKVSPADARRIVRSLHQKAITLDFDDIHDVRELDPPSGAGASDLSEEQIKWMRVFGSRSHEHTWPNGDKTIESIRPIHVVHFNVRTEGAESATIGLASHPRTVQFNRDGMSVEIETQLDEAYSWCSGCKTQYAALPSRGGKPNFLRAHLALIALLDHAQKLGMDVEVGDDGDYWNSRDQERLLAKLDEWNGLVAAITGRLKDAMPNLDGKFVARITDHPDFEHMEARGDSDLRRNSKDTDGP